MITFAQHVLACQAKELINSGYFLGRTVSFITVCHLVRFLLCICKDKIMAFVYRNKGCQTQSSVITPLRNLNTVNSLLYSKQNPNCQVCAALGLIAIQEILISDLLKLRSLRNTGICTLQKMLYCIIEHCTMYDIVNTYSTYIPYNYLQIIHSSMQYYTVIRLNALS